MEQMSEEFSQMVAQRDWGLIRSSITKKQRQEIFQITKWLKFFQNWWKIWLLKLKEQQAQVKINKNKYT